MIEVKFYKCTDDAHVVSKHLTDETAISGQFRGECDVLRPVITVESDVSDFSHFLLEGRYFYIDSIKCLRTGLWEVTGRVDVLKTYDSQIRQLTGTIDRQENMYNGYLADGNYKALAYKQIVTKTFPNGLNDDSLILMTVG